MGARNRSGVQIASLRHIHIPEERKLFEDRWVQRMRRDRTEGFHKTVLSERSLGVSCISAYKNFVKMQEKNLVALPSVAHFPSETTEAERRPMSLGSMISTERPLLDRHEDLRRTVLGIIEVADIDIAKRFVFKEPANDLIVACGWPRGIQVFCAAALSSMKCNVIILAPAHPPGLSVDILAPFATMCAWVRGSGLDVTDLVRAGVLQAKSCCVFSCVHVPWCHDATQKHTDTQAVLVREFIYALHHSDSMLERRLHRLVQIKTQKEYQLTTARTISGQSTLEDPYNDHDNPMLSIEREKQMMTTTPSRQTPLVMIELRSEDRIEFLDITPVRTAGDMFAKSQADNVWSQHGTFLSNPEFTSGRVLLEETLYGMICFSLPISRFCTDSRIVDHLASGVHVPLPEGFTPSCPLWMETLPASYIGLPFSALMDGYLQESLKLVIGVYRPTLKLSTKHTPLDLLQGEDASQYVVISCPPLDMTLEAGDRLYVIHTCPAEALGLLLSTKDSFQH